jgi:SAM-dependent methyltransferase
MTEATQNDQSAHPPSWDARVADYEADAEPLTRYFAEAALALAGGVVPGERVLDVAAGTGALTLVAARVGARVLGIDFLPGMIARLSARLLEECHADCEARVMDGQALELPDGSFDAAFSIFGVMLFPDWRRGLAELARVTRHGGRVIVAVWASDFGGGPTPVFMEASRRAFPDVSIPPPSAGMSHLKDPLTLTEELRAVGLSDVKVSNVDGMWSEPSKDWLIHNLDRLFGSMPFYARLDDADRKRLRIALTETLSAYATPEGVCVPTTALVGIGRRL